MRRSTQNSAGSHLFRGDLRRGNIHTELTVGELGCRDPPWRVSGQRRLRVRDKESLESTLYRSGRNVLEERREAGGLGGGGGGRGSAPLLLWSLALKGQRTSSLHPAPPPIVHPPPPRDDGSPPHPRGGGTVTKGPFPPPPGERTSHSSHLNYGIPNEHFSSAPLAPGSSY